MRTVTLIALVFLVAPFVRVAVQDTEVRLSHWPNGRVRSQIEARRNLQGQIVREGRAEVFHEDGSISARGRFGDDLEQGRWMWYTPGGALTAVCDYEDGVGDYRDLLPDGRVLRRGTLNGDRRVGVWREYYPSGRIKLEGTYVDDQQHGEWRAYTDEDPPRGQRVRFERGVIVEQK
jgi:antitoxin component YwqK of YwqJK toxin-antitoxin module